MLGIGHHGGVWVLLDPLLTFFALDTVFIAPLLFLNNQGVGVRLFGASGRVRLQSLFELILLLFELVREFRGVFFLCLELRGSN